ncbi:hypothetical protein CARN8_3010018 [mine drainage metagenome]|uniref:Uncharacterized protein n=1 Tax=mine drainage metagenome TaxID=410659 RepID=A0A3P3ZNP7_9ZZZZ
MTAEEDMSSEFGLVDYYEVGMVS